MTTAAILERALAMDDPYPDNVCPGCYQLITGWEAHAFHYPGAPTMSQESHRGDGSIASPWPFTTGDYGGVCAWDRDYLAARAHRRRLITEGITP